MVLGYHRSIVNETERDLRPPLLFWCENSCWVCQFSPQQMVQADFFLTFYTKAPTILLLTPLPKISRCARADFLVLFAMMSWRRWAEHFTKQSTGSLFCGINNPTAEAKQIPALFEDFFFSHPPAALIIIIIIIFLIIWNIVEHWVNHPFYKYRGLEKVVLLLQFRQMFLALTVNLLIEEQR